jgi:chemotaxis protein MotB
MRRLRAKDDNEDSNRWLMTYADLITLLLAFFVIMYAMSKVDSRRFGKMAEKLQGVFHGKTEEVADSLAQDDLSSGVLQLNRLKAIADRLHSPTVGLIQNRVNIGPRTNLADMSGADSTGDAVESNPPISVELQERGLVIRVLQSTLFRSGQAELLPEAKNTLGKIAEQIGDVPNQIRVEGYTDSLPIATSRYPSNWELSAARAAAVVRFLITEHNISPERISALGYGAFRPLVPNDTPQHRALNRRVDIVILTDNLSRYEPKPDVSQLAAKPAASQPAQTRNDLRLSLEDNSQQP